MWCFSNHSPVSWVPAFLLGQLASAALLSDREVGHLWNAGTVIPSPTANFGPARPAVDPLAYVKFGPAQFTTFVNASAACQACVMYYPTKQDGGRGHAGLYKATEHDTGGDETKWERQCRAGPCDFRDPQTQPDGGIIGKGPDFGNPDGKTCLTLEPVTWYSNCEGILQKSAASPLEVTQYCSYKYQLYFPPPAGSGISFANYKIPFQRFSNSQQCTKTIEKHGAALFGEINSCDSDLEALSSCCESVYGAMTCVQKGGVVLAAEDLGETMAVFEKYCVPLCKYTKEEFCAIYPYSDVCVTHQSCETCTASGGLWCPKLMSCHCPGPKPPPCKLEPKRSPDQCFPKPKPKKLRGPLEPEPAPAGPPYPTEPPKVCKYETMARTWAKDNL